MRRRRAVLLVLPAALLAWLGALPSTAGSADGPTIEPASNGYYFSWRPSTAAIGAGGTVFFRSTSTVIPHGVSWKGGPAAPSCSGVPVDEERTDWSGSCTFAQPGSYPFVCTTHPTEMKGTITVTTGETPTSPPPPPPPTDTTGSPLSGPASKAVRIRRKQRGPAVRGSIGLSRSGAGAGLAIELLARRASLLSAGQGRTVRVGRLVRASVRTRRFSFRLSLRRAARRALRQRRRLGLTVRIVLSPPEGDVVRLSRRVVLHV